MADKDSRYKKLEIPVFQSIIPSHLLGRLTDQERYLVETLSKMEQQNTWLIEAVSEGNRQIIDLDQRHDSTVKRIVTVETWKNKFSAKWAVIAAIGIVVSTYAIKHLIDHWLKP